MASYTNDSLRTLWKTVETRRYSDHAVFEALTRWIKQWNNNVLEEVRILTEAFVKLSSELVATKNIKCFLPSTY